MQVSDSGRAGKRIWTGLPGGGWLIALGCCLLAQAASAQYFVVASAPQHVTTDVDNGLGTYPTREFQGDPTASDLPTNNPTANTSPANNGAEPDELISPEGTALRIEQYRQEAGELGPSRWFSTFKFQFGVGATVAYDDNILFTSNSGKESDEITTLSGRIILSLGDAVERQSSFLYVDYTLYGNIYATHGDEDSLDQKGLFDGRYDWRRFSLEFMSNVLIQHDATSDVTQLESNDSYYESLYLRYHYSDKTMLVTEARVNINDSEFGLNNQQYTLNQAVDYQFTERTSLGLGVLVGQLNSNDGLHETFESPTARAIYRIPDKLFVTAAVGVDIRERGSYAGTGATPVFIFNSQWTPYEATTVTLNGFRRVDASESLSGQDFTATSVQLSLQQRFLQRFYALAEVDYSHDDYSVVSAAGSNVPARSDNYYYFRIGARYEALKYFNYGIYYRRQENDSNLSANSYASNRVYFQFNFLY